MSARLLVLTAGFGEGHNAAARAVAAACEDRHGPGSARVADLFSLAAPRLNAWTRQNYLGLINRAPWMWSAVYRWLDRSRTFPFLVHGLQGERRVLRRLLAEARPEAVCSTFPAYAFLLQRLQRAGELAAPHFNVVTDSISINSLWWRAGADGWFLPNQDSADVLRAAGIEESKLSVTGFPVPLFFGTHRKTLAPPHLPAGSAPRVLYIVNSGTRAAAETARRLLLETNWEVTCAVGHREGLRAELSSLARERKHPTSILGWTQEIPRLLMTHHVVISKAGGATTQEALAARCPMVVNQIVPGQEEGNYELLRRHGVGMLAETPEAVIAGLRRAFAERGRWWAEWRRAIEPLSRPDAAHDIVRLLLEGGRTEAAPRALAPQPASLPA